ncbi:hypothetical protein JG688_00008907 [Phytophthora aleatoria]|uniref:Alpha-1,3-mannosyltransferase n=1 Tax=Phytophthora aleatoria TaxID=2496075 RepID=A0A8J5J4A3_9STRA|nr:hypothetical protein JG688_00008907 [Phytophthora aleatoria]
MPLIRILNSLRRTPEQRQADEHALHVGILPSGGTTKRRSPNGPRLPVLDGPCTKTTPHGQSGYCELQDEDTGELFKVARRTCANVVGKVALFKCLEAPSGEHELKDGIVLVVYPKMAPSTYATIQVLRELAANNMIGAITFLEIDDPRAVEFATKVFAIYHSAFSRVLFLDSDNVLVRDPSFLFEMQEFVDTGAVFWPDFWHPQHTSFYLGEDSLLWGLLDMPFVVMFEQESGQLLIDRRRHAAALELLRFFTFHRPNPFVQLKLVWGDKDLFRLAWLKLGAPFFMIQSPPAVAGKAINGSFCSMTMMQHDAQGEVLSLHRNSHKLTGGSMRNPANEKLKTKEHKTEMAQENKELLSSDYPDAAIWTHLLSFRRSSPRSKYQIETYHVDEFSKDQICYGVPSMPTTTFTSKGLLT